MSMSVPPIEDDGVPRRPWARWVGLALAIVLMGGVAWKLSSGGAWHTLVESVRAASWTQLAALVGLPMLNLLLTAATFWVLTNGDEEGAPRVGLGEMTALIATAGVMNFLPVKAGMVGRVAYHKMWNGIPVRKSVRVIVVELVVSAAACAMLMMAAVVSVRAGVRWVWLASPIVACAAVASVLRARRGAGWRVAAALGLQYADMLAWGARYVVCFAVMGKSLTMVQSAALTAVAQVASLIPIGGSSLGLREWTIGLVSSALPEWAGRAAGTLAEGLSADLLNRTGEIMALVPLGVVGGMWVARRVGRGKEDPTGRPRDLRHEKHR